MNLTEVIVSSMILSMIVLNSVSIYSKSMVTLGKSFTKDKRMAEIHAINENVKYQVSRWRINDNAEYYLTYNITDEDCGDDMAQRLLDEMNIQTPNKLEADGHMIISYNEGFSPAHIYLPQSGFCP